jgi:hypothetical protein
MQPPPAQPHIAAPPYDVASDPGWRTYLDPVDHPFRNELNQMDPETRQLILARLMQQRALPPL